MPQTRFQIEEILSQDAHGAVFLAMDSQGGREVLLQRFFPFGAGEGGLEGEERVAYDQAIRTMQQLDHPNLRVIDGGSDPVDGMPFLVTEVRTGMSLAEHGEHAALTVAQGRVMVESALELMVWLEHRFGQTAEWLVLQSEDVEVMEEGERFRFCVDPMKWLGLRQGAGAVKDLALLVEAGMGWTGRVVTGSTAGMLSGWLRMAKTRDMTVHEALAVLRTGQLPEAAEPVVAEPVVAEPVVAAPSAIFAPVEPVVPMQNSYAPLAMPAKSGGHALWYVLGSVCCVGLLAAGGWAWTRFQKPKFESAAVQSVNPSSAPVLATGQLKEPLLKEKIRGDAPAPPLATDKEEKLIPASSEEQIARERVERMARELQKQATEGNDLSKEAAANKPKSPKREGDYLANEVELITEQIGEEICVLGTVKKVSLSSTAKSLYIEYGADEGGASYVRGRYETNRGVSGMSVSELGYLEGKKVRIRGVPSKEFGTGRLIIDLSSPDQIEVLDP